MKSLQEGERSNFYDNAKKTKQTFFDNKHMKHFKNLKQKHLKDN